MKRRLGDRKTNHKKTSLVLLIFLGACTVDPVSSIPSNRFQCDDPALCPPDSGVKDIPDRVIDMSQDADTGPEQNPDASDAGFSGDVVLDASDTGFPGDGFLDAQDMGTPDQGFIDPADAGFPDSGRDAGIGFDVGTSTSCDWLSSTGSGDCDRPVSIETGEFHTCAIRESGSVACWGRNTDGQLGDGTNQGRSHPVTVLGLTETSSITIGAHHTCALENGAVWCWGKNELGQLGVSETLYPNISYPIQVLDQNDLPLEGVTQIDAGDNHTCALKPSANSNNIYCWGDNAHLQAGLAETFNFSDRARPVQLAREYFSIGVGGNTTCALAYDNNVENGYCWGQNDYGQTGTGTISRAVPVTNRSGIGDNHREALFSFTQYVIKVGKKHACIRNQYGNLFCWGDNRYRQVLAHQSTAVVLAPELVLQPDGFLGQTSLGELVLGDKHSCVDRVHPIWGNSGIVCWGNNDRSQLAFQNTSYSGYPWRQNLSQRQFPISLSAGGETTCAITNAQQAFCWGDNKDNELGDGSLAYANRPILVPEVANVTSVESGNGLTCITRTSSVSNDEFTQCWGRNDFGQLGNGNQTQTPTPQTLNQGGQLSAGTHHVCQTNTTAPRVIGKCWGNNQYGQLSAEELRLGSTSTTPRVVRSYESNGGNFAYAVRSWADKIIAGDDFTCAYKLSNQSVACAGKNDEQQLGLTTQRDDLMVRGVHPMMGGEINAGRAFACAANNGGLSCWGSNTFGQLGVATSSLASSSVPQSINSFPLGSIVYEFEGGYGYACSRLDDTTQGQQRSYCWGRNEYGQLANGNQFSTPTAELTHTSSSTPLENVEQVSTGWDHACARLDDGSIYCWGRNDYGQVGDQTSARRRYATEVLGAQPSSAVSAGASHSCSITNNQTLECWGSNRYEQLGYPFQEKMAEPNLVVQPH